MKHFITMVLTFLILGTPLWADDTVYIDVRSPAEYDQGHIDGALLMPHDKIAGLIGKAQLSPDTPIVLYCRSGRRAELARQTLKNLGYTNVTNAGGYGDLARKLAEDCTKATC